MPPLYFPDNGQMPRDVLLLPWYGHTQSVRLPYGYRYHTDKNSSRQLLPAILPLLQHIVFSFFFPFPDTCLLPHV